MKKKCSNCNLVNYAAAENCLRCGQKLLEVSSFETTPKPKKSLKAKILKRGAVLLFVVLFTLGGFYVSLIGSAKRLEYDQKKSIERSILILEDKGFGKEVFLLRYLTAYRGTDNWLNASTREENAYAATNFPFEVMTIYPDFFTYPADETERAAILLHEAQHLKGADEREAYEFVWKNRKQLGWTRENYGNSVVWRNVRKQTKEVAPNLFVCEANEYNDCTE
jgi:hypothetical protein